jgi:hypothetical protein
VVELLHWAMLFHRVRVCFFLPVNWSTAPVCSSGGTLGTGTTGPVSSGWWQCSQLETMTTIWLSSEAVGTLSLWCLQEVSSHLGLPKPLTEAPVTGHCSGTLAVLIAQGTIHYHK